MRLHNRSRCAILADRAVIATSSPVPPPGLILQAPPKAGEALVIWTGGRSLATEPRAVDVLFVGPDGQVVGYEPSVSPPRLVPAEAEADLVIELPAGTVEHSGTQIGDYIEFS